MVMRSIERRVLSNFDWQLAVSMLLLCVVGLGLLYSAGYNPETKYSPQMRRQFAAIAMGVVAFLCCALLNTTFWRRWAFPFYAIGCLLLGVVLFKGVVAGGAQRWLELGGMRIQPSEFMKLALILALARVFSSERAPRDGYTFVSLLFPCCIIGLPIVLIVQQPDLGTALCYLLIAGSILLFAGITKKTLTTLVLVGVALAVTISLDVKYKKPGLLRDYQRARILAFMEPERDLRGSGWHAQQSKIAVGSGAIFGKGFLQGTQTQLRFLPEQTTDFIFSVLAEEWGFAGSLVILFLYAFLIIHALGVAARCSDRFSVYVAVGVSMLLLWHVVINIGMVVGILPVVGLTLPFLSFGGSSVVTFMAALGLVAGISMRRFSFA